MSGSLDLHLLSRQVGEIEVDVLLVRAASATFAHLLHHRPGDHVTGGEVLDGGCVALHETFTGSVAQDCHLRHAHPRSTELRGRPGPWDGIGKNSMSSNGSPLRQMMPIPSPVSVWALEVVFQTFPKPPVAKTTDFARNT